MSFLASLRKQDSDDKQDQQLHYLLTIDHLTSEMILRLCIASQQEIASIANKPYSLQREHLYRPPSFIQHSDKKILQELSDSRASWFNTDKGPLPENNTWSLLQEIIATQRCYLLHQNSVIAVKAGEPDTVYPYWSINTSGEYQLGWQLQENLNQYKLIFCTQKPKFYFTANDTAAIDSIVLGPVVFLEQHRQTPPRLNISVNDIDKYIQQRSKNWQKWALPRPPIVDTVVADTEIKPLLICHDQGTPQLSQKNCAGDIQLLFSLCSDKYCSLPQNTFDDCIYWDGKTLHRLAVDNKQGEHLKNTITRRLSSFTSPNNEKCIWYIQHQQQWQHLFTDLYAPLNKLNVSFCTEAGFRHHYAYIESWDVRIKERENGDLNLSVLLQAKDIDIELQEFLDQLRDFNYRSKDSHIYLQRSDGRLWLVPAGDVLNLMEELEDLDYSQDGFHLPHNQRHRLADIEHCTPASTHWSGDTEYLNESIELHKSPVVLNKTLDFIKAQLRPYQWLGVCWIQHMKQHTCNGLLADDMGLGKTLQALTHLAFEKTQGNLAKPALIVMPLSLLHNWQNEIKRFAPQLSCKIIHGSKRHDNWTELNNYDVLLTTYHLVASDLSYWNEQRLSWLILDEAQSIKNPSTRYSKAVREIPCEHKLCLSGTPVENHLGELWSIISFLMPGYLGSRREFRDNFQKPIEQAGDEKQMQRLLKRIAPFILRRTKDQIAKDLPAKTEIEQLIPLSSEQYNFYEQLKHETWQELQAKINEENESNHSIAALSALLKLRQACCDPGLFPDVDLPSAKRQYCIEMIEELVAENRAVLVFSQFTQMLDILDTSLAEKNISTLKLTGKTRNRQTMVDAFQRGEAPVFLISLKAGGTGLNLTRADTVIHYDPWWNAAAQQQASDRAHRIGQDKPVFVYKLIAENTIEEKIAQLQAQKMALSQHVDNQAQLNAETFAFKFEELLTLWEEDKNHEKN